MTPRQHLQKRTFDLFVAILGLLLLGWFILLLAFLAYLDTGKSGFFYQTRIGKKGKRFQIIKIRSLKAQKIAEKANFAYEYHISNYGKFLRKIKLDELPQLWNVFIGQMSLVGPRPDLPGFADQLKGDDRLLLSVRPGITGPASIKFKNEDALLAAQSDPEKYNREVIWPEKVRINRAYIHNYSVQKDIELIFRTFW